MTETRPLRADLYAEGSPPRLIGSRCRETGEVFFPQQTMNPITHRAGTMERAEIDGAGTLVNFTRVLRSIPGFRTPFAIGVVKLDAGPTLTAQLHDWDGVDLFVGQHVDLVIGPIKHDANGTAVMGPKFRPAAETRR